MNKRTKKAVAVMSSVALAASLMIPLDMAFADATFKVTRKGTAKPGGTFDAKIQVEIPQNSLAEGDKFRLVFPKDTIIGSADDETDGILINAPDQVDGNDGNQVTPGEITADVIKAEEEYEVPVTIGAESSKGLVTIELTDVKVPGGHSGDFDVRIESEAGSAFGDAKLTIATVGTGSANISLDGLKSFSSGGGALDTIRINEDRPGALKVGVDSIKFKLPSGFEWDLTELDADRLIAFGDDDFALGDATLADSGRTLRLGVNSTSSKKAVKLTIRGLKVKVDESVAKSGDLKVSISGKSTTSPSEAVVAHYGDFSAEVAAFGDAPTLVAGNYDEEVGKFKIEESLGGSLTLNRSVTLTLPENTRWNVDDAGKPVGPTIDSTNSDENGLEFRANDENVWVFVDSEKRTIKTLVSAVSTDGNDPGKIVFEKGEVQIAPGFSGDLNVEVGGNSGLNGKVLLGKVVAPVSLSAASVPEVKIGVDGQLAGEVTITENFREALSAETENVIKTFGTADDAAVYESKTFKELRLYVPSGVDFTSTPKFEVVEGDIALEQESATTKTDTDGLKFAVVRVKSTSSTPSKIKVSNVKLRVDRTVPEGDLILKVKGNTTSTSSFVDGSAGRPIFASSTVTSAPIAKVVTPAPGETTYSATFKVGEAKYTVQGVEKSADLAPYVKDGRTYLPIRYVAEALGISDANIIWDGEKQTVTLFKGDKAAQLTVGSNILLVNGIPVTMDVAPEIPESAGRVTLPIRWVATAFGASVTWDDATQTATIK